MNRTLQKKLRGAVTVTVLYWFRVTDLIRTSEIWGC